MRITMEIAEDGSTSVTIESPGAEPEMMDFASADEALDAIEDRVEMGAGDMPQATEADMMQAEMMDEEMDAEAAMTEEEMQAMWNEEAKRRAA